LEVINHEGHMEPSTLAELDARLTSWEKRTHDLELMIVALVTALAPDLGARGRASLARVKEGTGDDQRARFEV
jgi:hypothetical protein